MSPPLTPFGHPMRSHFLFSPSYTPLNHGSFGTIPQPVRRTLHHYQSLAEHHPDTFIRFTYPPLLDEARGAVASLVKAPTDEIVFVSNATTGVNTVLRSIAWEEGDVIVYFETIYGAVGKTIDYIVETTKAEKELVDAHWPISDSDLLTQFETTIRKINAAGAGKRRVRLAIFDTIISMPGLRMPFELLTAKCKEHNILSLIDAAHAIGQIPLDLSTLQPDFFVSNLHKWLFSPRGHALLYVAMRNQHLIRSSLPTSHSFTPLSTTLIPSPASPMPPITNTPFVGMFQFIGTIDNANYLCVPSALRFREEVCGGEEAIMNYCVNLAREGGDRVAEILGTEILDNSDGTLRNCAFANVRVPLTAGRDVAEGDEMLVTQWLGKKSAEEFETFLAVVFYRGAWWWRMSAQIYLDVEDFVWGAGVVRELCERVKKGEYLEIKAKL